jgi:hypothetical protein
MKVDLEELKNRVHAANAKWWVDINTGEPIERNRDELLMLVITELSEAVEGIRKDLMDDHLPHRKMEEVEIADAMIRLLDYCGGFDERVSYASEIINKSTKGSFEDSPSKAADIFDICYYVTAMEVEKSLISMYEYCNKWNLDLFGSLEEKLAYNATRADHTHEARREVNGKKF